MTEDQRERPCRSCEGEVSPSEWQQGLRRCRRCRFGECLVDGCNNSAHVKGFCLTHRLERCKADGCDNAAKAKGFCATHNPTRCQADGCDNAVRARGLCYTHTRRGADHTILANGFDPALPGHAYLVLWPNGDLKYGFSQGNRHEDWLKHGGVLIGLWHFPTGEEARRAEKRLKRLCKAAGLRRTYLTAKAAPRYLTRGQDGGINGYTEVVTATFDQAFTVRDAFDANPSGDRGVLEAPTIVRGLSQVLDLRNSRLTSPDASGTILEPRTNPTNPRKDTINP